MSTKIFRRDNWPLVTLAGRKQPTMAHGFSSPSLDNAIARMHSVECTCIYNKLLHKSSFLKMLKHKNVILCVAHECSIHWQGRALLFTEVMCLSKIFTKQVIVNWFEIFAGKPFKVKKRGLRSMSQCCLKMDAIRKMSLSRLQPDTWKYFIS